MIKSRFLLLSRHRALSVILPQCYALMSKYIHIVKTNMQNKPHEHV